MKEIKRPGDDGMRTNNVDWREAREVPDNLVEDTEIVKREVRIHFLGHEPFSFDYIQSVFQHGRTLEAQDVTAVTVTEEVVTTFRRSKVQ